MLFDSVNFCVFVVSYLINSMTEYTLSAPNSSKLCCFGIHKHTVNSGQLRLKNGIHSTAFSHSSLLKSSILILRASRDYFQFQPSYLNLLPFFHLFSFISFVYKYY